MTPLHWLSSILFGEEERCQGEAAAIDLILSLRGEVALSPRLLEMMGKTANGDVSTCQRCTGRVQDVDDEEVVR
jgi:hypothetical protein